MKRLFSTKDILIEAYVAYPPTSLCNQIICIIEEVANEFKDKTEVRVWMKGHGIKTRGGEFLSSLTFTPGLQKASKESIIPAIIINGKLVFEKIAPSKDELRRFIIQELENGN
ncbi:MAG: hypothetical protein QXG01_01785 [Candidatus Bathyarchaeia archaeon]